MRATLRHRVTDLWRRSLRRRSLKDWAFIIVLFVVLGLVAYKSFVPSRQDKLVNALTSFRSQYQSASGNDLQRNQIRDARNRFLCTFINGAPQVENWTGRVKSIDQVWGGLLSEYGFDVYIGDDISLETYGGALGEQDQRNAATPTNIQAGSKLAGVLGGLQKGDRVTFSGEFILDRKGCASERSMTTGGSFRAPQILFRFTTINGVSGNEPPPVSSITDGEKLRSLWLSADSNCTRPSPSYSQARIDKACRDRAAADAQLRAIGWCFGKTKPGDADHWHKCGTITQSR